MVEKRIARHLSGIRELLGFLREGPPVYIQTHNFPDHDAVASAFALQTLFAIHDIPATIVYDGDIERDSLRQFADDMEIELHPADQVPMHPEDRVVIVDGCKGNKNVTDLIGDEVAVIDHHQVVSPEDVEYSDIRSDYGACVSVIADYFRELGIDIPHDVATAAMVGINFDTSQLTRGVHEADLETYFEAYKVASVTYVHYIVRNTLKIADLDYYRKLLEGVRFSGRIAYGYFPGGCPQNLMGVLGDFLLTLDESEFVVLCARNEGRVNVSLRNENADWDASVVVRQLLDGVGFGGGHAHMAGGVVPDAANFDAESVLPRVEALLS